MQEVISYQLPQQTAIQKHIHPTSIAKYYDYSAFFFNQIELVA
jgi:hypothetical protein